MSGASFIFVLIILAIIAIAVCDLVLQNKRHKEFSGFAAANGWFYLERDDDLTGYWGNELHGRGKHKAVNVFKGYFGQAQRPFVAFSHIYTELNSKNKTVRTHTYEVCLMRMPVALPRLQVTREGLLTKITQLFGGQDIDFESDDFNRLYHIQSDNLRFAYGVIHPLMMEWMLGAGQTLTPWIINETYLLTVAPGRLDSSRFPQKLQAMNYLLEQIPEHVWTDSWFAISGGN